MNGCSFLSTALIGAVVALSSFAPTSAFAAQDCAGLANLKIDNTNLLSAAEVPASDDLPAYCRVLGYVRPAINFEVKLPVQGWSGKFYMVGCGGYCGTLNSEARGFNNAMNFGLRRNYAVSASDAGHWGAAATDARWAMNNPVAVMDWAQRYVPETARVSKIILKAYYGTEQEKSYFAGCSQGGRIGLVEAMRNPKDFDGIISGAPALDTTGLHNFIGWVAKANSGPDGKSILSSAKVRLLQDGVSAACGEKGGSADPIIADPRACHFRPSTLQCRAGDGADCLTQAEVNVAEKIYGGPVNSHGQRLYPSGVPLSSEPFWPRWITGTGGPQMSVWAQSFFSYAAFDPPTGPSFKLANYDFDKDPPRLAYTASIINAATFNPSSGKIEFDDMNAFRRAGGKLVMWHGWADALVPPQLTVDFYEALSEKSGGVAATQDFARLFMVPGMDHCGIQTTGPGIADTGIDPLTALEQWVEQGKAPTELISTKMAPIGNQTLWRRPVCAYPKAAHYKGSGDPTDATSFTCTDP
jgi:Tannase and feruloyl esterase